MKLGAVEAATEAEEAAAGVAVSDRLLTRGEDALAPSASLLEAHNNIRDYKQKND